MFADVWLGRPETRGKHDLSGGNLCPVSAIFALDDLPEKWKLYTELNASYVQGGKFTSEEYARHQAAK